MKKRLTLNLILSFLFLSVFVNGQETRLVNINAGELALSIPKEDRSLISELIIQGTIDIRDFITMRDSMRSLVTIDLCAVNIKNFSGEHNGRQLENADNEIVSNAFCKEYYSNSVLQNLILPSGTEVIGDYAFARCQKIQYFDIPKSVEKIGIGAFLQCQNLISIILPSELKIISDNSFENCEKLTTIKIPEGLVEVGSYAFSYCKSLSSLDLPNTLTTIGQYAFYNCTSLLDMSIPESVTFIGESVFDYCTSLSSFEFNANVTEIPNGMFYRSGLRSIIIPPYIESVGDNSFGWCRNLTSVTLPNNLQRLGVGSFSGTGIKAIAIPAGITSLPQSVLSSCSSLETVDLPEGLKSIGNSAFYSCDSLNNILFPSTLTEIGEKAFGSCDGLSIVEISENINFIGNNVFEYCHGLTNVNMSSCKIKKIPDNAFLNCTKLVTITLPDQLSEIGNNSFFQCSSLKLVKIPDNVNVIREYAFSHCVLLDNIIIPHGVTTIPAYSFYGCSSLSNISLPPTIVSIGGYAFAYCKSLVSISLPSSIVQIGREAFSNCSILDQMELPSVITKLEIGIFSGCKKLRIVNIPTNVFNIAHGAFNDCCSLKEIELPATVDVIENEAFRNCVGLEKIVAKRKMPIDLSGLTDVFFAVKTESCVLYVPEGSKQYYSVTEKWKDFVNIQEMTSLQVTPAKVLFPDSASTLSVEINSSTGWNISENIDWLSVNPTSGSGSAFLNLKAEANLFPSERKGFVVINDLLGNQKTVLVEQRRKSYLNCDLNKLTIEDSDSSYVINVQSNIDWRLNCDVNWLKLTPKYGSNNQSISVSADESPNKEIRRALVELIGENGDTIIINVDQLGGLIKISPEKKNYFLFAIEGSNEFINVNSNVSWDVQSNTSWIEVIETVSADGSGTIKVIAEQNPFEFERNTKIYLTFNSVVYDSINIIQYGYIRNKTVHVEAGTLIDQFNNNEILTVENIYVDGKIDARDFKFIRDKLRGLIHIDLEQTQIVAYNGPGGTYYRSTSTRSYPENTIPVGAFCINYIGDYVSNGALQSFVAPSSLVEISEFAFKGCYKLQKCNLPNSVVRIGIEAFMNCSSMAEFKFNSGIETIENKTFYNCRSLEEVSLPSTVKYVNNEAFRGCVGLKSIQLSDNLLKIGSSSFSGASSLFEVNIPQSVTEIGRLAFSQCDRLESVIVDANIEYLDNSVFEKDSSLISVVLSEALTELKYGVFQGCSKLEIINLPSKLKVIGTSVFSDCKRLRTINIPESVLRIDGNAFSNCKLLETLTLPENLTTIGDGAFRNNESIVEIEIPESVSLIGYGVFQNCINLESINIPSRVTRINDYVFDGCKNLKKIEIPSSVKYLGTYCFRGCEGLSDIIVSWNNPSEIYVGYQALNDPIKLRSNLYVPFKLKPIYETINNWKELNIIEKPGFFLSSMQIQLSGSNLSSGYINIESNSSWFVSTDADWLEVSPINGNFNDTIVFVAKENKTGNVRNAEVTVKINEEINEKILVYQNIGASTLTVSDTLFVINAIQNGEVNFIIDSNSEWRIETTSNWISVYPSNGSGSDTISVVLANSDEITVRSGTITVFTNSGMKETIEVVQNTKSIYVDVEIVAGELSKQLSGRDLRSITHITLKGTIDARDIKTIKESLNFLEYIDISGTHVVYYKGRNGVSTTEEYEYLRNVLPPYSFEGKSKLRTLKLPESIVEIGNCALQSLIELSDFELPSGVGAIGDYAFNMCKSLSDINISQNVISIGKFAFQNFGGFITVAADNGNYASENGILFNKSKSLLIQAPTILTGNYYLPSTVRKINESAFLNCQELLSINLGYSVETIDKYAFQNCISLAEIVFPSSLDSLNDMILYGCTSLAKVTLPNSIVYLGAGVFRDCSSLDNVTIPVAVRKMDSYVFMGCKKLKEINFKCAIDLLPNELFMYCESLKYFTIPASVKRINQMAFAYSGIDSIVIPNSVAYMQSGVFQNSKIRYAKLSEGLTLVAKEMFKECSKLEKVIIPKQINTIDVEAFALSGIKEILIPSTVYSINDFAFGGCYNLTNIELPKTISTIGRYAFSYCHNLKMAKLNAPIPKVSDGLFAQSENLETVFLPSTIKVLGDRCFSGCVSMKSISLPANLIEIQNSAFIDCSGLISMELPEGVNRIDKWAFRGCTKLSYFRVNRSSPVDLSGVYGPFEGVDLSKCELQVPMQSVDIYRNTIVWKDFKAVYGITNLEVEKTQINIEADSSFEVLNVVCNSSWNINSDANWVIIDNLNYNGNSEVKLKILANPTTIERNAKVTVTADGALPVSVCVNQKGQSKLLNIDQQKIVFNSSNHEYKYLVITSNTDWEIYTDDSWLTIYPQSGSGNKLITIRTFINESYYPREGHINIKTNNNAINRTVNIFQRGDSSKTYVSVDQNELVFNSNKSVGQLIISSNSEWNIKFNQEWISVSKISGIGNDTLAIHVDENDFEFDRSGVVKFYTNDDSVLVNVLQTASFINRYLNINPEKVVLDYNKNEFKLVIESNVDWKISSSYDWIDISKNEGRNNDTIWVNVEENQYDNSRYGYIYIESSLIPLKGISITQEGKPEAYHLSINTTEFDFNYNRKDTCFIITSNVDWRIQNDASWISCIPNSGNGNDTVTVVIEENYQKESREDYIYIVSDKLSKQEIVIKQEVKPLENYLFIKEKEFLFNSGLNDTIFVINSNASWEIESNASWINCNPNSGFGNDTIVVSIEANLASEARENLISILSGGLQTQEISIYQSGYPIENYLDVNLTELSFDSDISDSLFIIESNVSWEIQIDVPWISCTPLVGEDSMVILVNIDTNYESESRESKIYIVSNDQLRKEINVSQKGKPNEYYIDLSTNELNFGYAKEYSTFFISSNIEWKIYSDVNWLAFNTNAGTGNSEIIVTCDSNSYNEVREAYIYIEANGLSVTKVKVIQKANEIVYYIEINPLELDFDNTDLSSFFTINSNDSWIIEFNEKWISINKTSGVGNDTIWVIVEKNEDEERIGEISISGEKGSTNRIVVTQDGKTADVYLELEVIRQEVSENGGDFEFDVRSNSIWSIKVDVDWIKLNSYNGENSQMVQFTVLENKTLNNRTGSILINNQKDSIVFEVLQTGSKPYIDLSVLNYVFDNTTTNQVSIEVKTNDNWIIGVDVDWIMISSDLLIPGDTSILVTVTNNEGNDRCGNISFSNGTQRIDVLVCQMQNITDSNKSIGRNGFLCYPNPVSSWICIKGLEQNTEISIVDLTGRIVLRTIVESEEFVMDLNDLVKGDYCLYSKNGEKLGKFVKE